MEGPRVLSEDCLDSRLCFILLGHLGGLIVSERQFNFGMGAATYANGKGVDINYQRNT
jgi:hypothetical protein